MPEKNAKGTAKSKAEGRSKASKNPKNLLIILTAIIGTGLIVAGGVWLQRNGEITKGQKTIETYLEKKYDQDFIVERPAFKGYGLGVEGVQEAQAYPKDNPGLKFSAWTNSYGSNDEYPGAFWQKQARDYLEPSVIRAFGYTPEFTVDVYTANIQGKQIHGHLPAFTDALTNYRDRLNIKLTVSSREKVDQTSKLLVAQRSYDLIKELEQTKAAVFSVNYINTTGGGLTYRKDSKGEVTVKVDHAEDLLSIVKAGE